MPALMGPVLAICSVRITFGRATVALVLKQTCEVANISGSLHAMHWSCYGLMALIFSTMLGITSDIASIFLDRK